MFTHAAPRVRASYTTPSYTDSRGSVHALEEFHGSVALPDPSAGFFRHWRAFVGPAFLVSVGYMDPGNWATDLEAGAKFRYQLLWVVALSSLMAMVMQVLSARLGVVTGKNLAQACRDYYPAWSRWPNWFFCEIAIVACDLAEVLGSAVALNLLFHIPLLWAVVITAFDVILLLTLQGMGMRILEAIILVLVATIGVCYYIEIFVLPPIRPDFAEMGQAMLAPGFSNGEALWLAIGIIGATVMPHNLYLHSALVQSRRLQPDEQAVRRAIRFNSVDTIVALSIAFLINAAILVLAVLVFNRPDQIIAEEETDWIREAHRTLAPLLGTAAASTLFAVALLASGQSSTITGTLAGQVVMEGFLQWRMRPWLRRLVTRLLAVVPAVLIIGLRGDASFTKLIQLSQVVLAFQLPFAMFPLLHFTSTKSRMGQFANGRFLLIMGWTSALLITALAIYSLPKVLPEAWEVITGG